MKSPQRFCRVHELTWGLHNKLISKNTMQFIADHRTPTVGARKREREELAPRSSLKDPEVTSGSLWPSVPGVRLSTQLPQIVAQDDEFTHSFA